jgi:hypothetical protein
MEVIPVNIFFFDDIAEDMFNKFFVDNFILKEINFAISDIERVIIREMYGRHRFNERIAFIRYIREKIFESFIMKEPFIDEFIVEVFSDGISDLFIFIKIGIIARNESIFDERICSDEGSKIRGSRMKNRWLRNDSSRDDRRRVKLV